MKAEDYNEQVSIEYAVVGYHQHLLTQFEREVLTAFYRRGKAEAYGKPDLGQTYGYAPDQRIDAIVARGSVEFRRNVTERVMREDGDKVILNRCPQCMRIVRTPRAKQCCWCYADWH